MQAPRKPWLAWRSRQYSETCETKSYDWSCVGQGHQVWWEAPDSPPTVVSGEHLRHGGQKKLYGFELVNCSVEKGLKVQKLWSPNINIGVEKPDFKETGIWPSQRSSFLMLVFFCLLNSPCSWWLTAVFPAFDRHGLHLKCPATLAKPPNPWG